MNIKMRTQDTLFYNPPLITTDTGALYPISETNSLSWRLRPHEWGRWKLTRNKPDPDKPSPPEKNTDRLMVLRGKNETHGNMELILNSFNSMTPPVPQDQKDLGMHTTYEATVGHFLYKVNTDDYNIRSDDYEFGAPGFFSRFSGKQRVGNEFELEEFTGRGALECRRRDLKVAALNWVLRKFGQAWEEIAEHPLLPTKPRKEPWRSKFVVVAAYGR